VHGVDTHMRLVLGFAFASFVAVYAALVFVESPGLGLGHFFYIPIALVALVTGPRLGAIAGAGSAALYALAIVLNPALPSFDVITISTPIRLLTFAASGALIGWYAQRNRELIERLEVLAERDRLTGLPNMRAFEEAVDRLFREQRPFGLLLGDMDGLREANEELGHGGGDVVLVRLAETLGKLLGPEERLARVGGDEFAILTTTRSKDAAADRANQLESFLADEGLRVTFGWAAFPGEGTNALGLVRVADERLYARKLVRGRRNGEPQQAKLGLTA
jgi:diguanylate cyclase (GGDEF)-like protein